MALAKIEHKFSEYSRNKEVESFSEIVANDNATDDDIQRWSFDRIDRYGYDYQVATYYNGELAALLFYKWYGNYLRINIGQYLPTKFRKYLYRWPFYPNGGAFAEVKKNVRTPLGYFGTFYAKNKKLAALVKSLRTNKQRGFSKESSDWDKFKIYQTEPIMFRYVPQWIMYYNQIGNTEENLQLLYKILEEDK